MMEKKISPWMILFIASVFSIFFMFPNSDVVQMIESDGISEISCGSDSMGLSLTCRQNVRHHYVEENEILIPGELYIYTTPWRNGTNIVHRLIGCVKIEDNEIIEKCEYWNSFLIFKGDNNPVMDKPLQYTPDIWLRHVDIIYSD